MAGSDGTGRMPPESAGGSMNATGGSPGLRLAIPLVLLAAGALSLWLMRGVELSGDEEHYYGVAGQIARCILGDASFAESIGSVVARGWFLPGMAFLLTPVQLAFGGAAPVAVARAWIIAVNVGLLALIARQLLRSGISARWVLWGVSASFLVPFYACFMGCLWGELVAMHAAILFMLVLERHVASFGPLLGTLCGVAVACITYCRPQFFLLLGLVAVRAVLAFADGGIGNPRKLCGGLLTMAATWVVAVAPWQWAIQSRYGPFFLVVSTAERPFVIDEHYRANHGLTGNPWVGVHEHLAAEAARNGLSLRGQIRASAREIPKPSLSERVAHQAAQSRRYYGNDTVFLERFQRIDRAGTLSDPAWRRLQRWNAVSWRLWLAAGVVLMLLPFGAGPNLDYRLPVVFKGLAGLVAVQPILYEAHGRYHVALIPLISIFTCLAVATGTRVPGGSRASRLALRAVQAASLLLVAVTACLLLYRG